MRSIILTMFALAAAARAGVTIVVDRNMGDAATPQFRFAHVPSPSRDDAATNARVELIAGHIDRGSPGLAAINDGRVPADWDEPGSNLFFAPGTWGGRVRIDLGAVVPVAQINSYSWHPDSRAAQLYKVYGSDGSDPAFNDAPESKIDPATRGWKLIAFVDTRPREGETGGQYGVSALLEQRKTFGPAGDEIVQRQGVKKAAIKMVPTMGHQIHFHKARAILVPLREHVHRNLGLAP